KFVYTVPTFQNPGGVTLSTARRRRLVEVAHERELLVLEDNPYGLLRYEGAPPPPLLSLDGGVYVMYLGTFSKILSPGIRLGWVVAPPPVLEKINLGKQAADLCTSTLSQLMVQAYFAEGRWRDYVDSLTEIYRARRDTMLDALADHFPPQAERRSCRCRTARLLILAVREVLGRDVVEEVLELLDDLLRVLHLVLEFDGGLGDHVLGGEDRRAGTHGERQRVRGPG